MNKTIIFILAFSNIIIAQRLTVVNFLLIHPSPNLNSMVGAYTALPSDDPYGPYYNPAQVAYLGGQNSFTMGFYPSKSEYLPSFNFSNQTYHSVAAAGGYKFIGKNNILPINVGIGFIHTKLDLGENVWTDENGTVLGSSHSYESYNGLSFGIGIKYYVNIYLGYTFKRISIDDGSISTDQINFDFSGKANAHDLGILLVLPFIDLYKSIFKYELSFLNFRPTFNYGMGISLLNYGDEIALSEEDDSEPIPKLCKAGHSISLGFCYDNSKYKLGWLNIEYSSEAEEYLVKGSPSGTFVYESFPGKIRLWENIIRSKVSDDIKVRHGWNIELFESFKYSMGNFSQQRDYGHSYESVGFMIRTKGLSKIINSNIDADWLDFFTKHVDLRYTQSEYESHDKSNIFLVDKYKGISLHIFGF